ncbi:hypothetical protein VNO77_18388 [Canavalia gladiata]|uniref:Uncharacterized protein n=1 Tax=Canavalia gladiata TaxID=3824 RepID=A0AAN9LKU1_CANGL
MIYAQTRSHWPNEMHPSKKVGMAYVREFSNGNKGKKACSYKSTSKVSDLWPFRIKLTTECMRWDSLKITPSKEFEEHIVGHMNESNSKALKSWIPVNILIHDVDNRETYEAKLSKKESFWFDPMPILGEKSKKGECLREPPCYDFKKAREEFAYSIEPFRNIITKRGLKYDQEIGLRYCGDKVVEGFEFSVLHSSSLDIHSFRI